MTGLVGALSQRGGFARTIVHWGMALAALAFGSWWTSHTILDTARTRSVAHTVLGDTHLRNYVASRVASVVNQTVGATTVDAAIASSNVASGNGAALNSRLAAVLSDPGIRTQLETFVVQAHERLIGERDQPAVLSKSAVDLLVAGAVPTMKPEDVLKIPEVRVSVPTASVLSTGARALKGRFWQYFGGAVGLLAVAIAISGDRHATVKTIGKWLLGISAGHVVAMWIIPVIVVPKVSNSPWAGLISKVARAYAGGVIGGLVALVIAGVACLFVDRFVPPGGRDADGPPVPRMTP